MGKIYSLKDEFGSELDDHPYGIEQTSDGGYIIIGNSGKNKTRILKIDETGKIEWQKISIYFSQNIGSFGCDIKQTNDGGYALTNTVSNVFGQSGYDFGLTKLNNDGSFAWRGVYGDAEMQYLSSMQITDDGGFIIAGHTIDTTTGSIDRNLSLVRINPSGEILWQKQYASDNPAATDTGAIIRNTPDGGFIVGGYTQANGNDTWVLKLDSDGNISWQKRYYDSTPGPAQQNIYDIKCTSDEGYIFVGINDHATLNQGELWIVKIKSDGSILWDKSYTWGYGDGYLTTVRSVNETSDGGYIIAGSKKKPSSVLNDVFVMKVNEFGNIPGCSLTEEEGFTVAVDMSGVALNTNYSQDVIISHSIIDIDSEQSDSNAYNSYLCLPSNDPPLADHGGPYTGNEGSPVTFYGTGSWDPDGDLLTYYWTFGDNYDGSGAVTDHTYAENGIYGVCITVTDPDGLSDTKCTIAEIANVDPAVGPITGPVEPVQVNTTVDFSADFTDQGTEDTHVAAWDWGDGNSDTIDSTTSPISANHIYEVPGVYTIEFTVTDDDDGVGTSLFQYVVVYDMEGGFVTGGGWIDSPAGAYAADPSLTGKANFGFVSKYKKGATTPTGETEFQFKVADLNFHSDAYEWLVIAGAKAMYKGTGTINGIGNYGFMLSAIDEKLTSSTDVDLFRIKIWDKDNNDVIVYDNKMGEADDIDPTTAIGGGSIVIHKK